MSREEEFGVQAYANTAPIEEIRKGRLDLIILKYMARRVLTALHTTDSSCTAKQPLLYMVQERHARTHRIVLYGLQTHVPQTNMLFVGFISRKQPGLSPSTIQDIHAVDQKMLTELSDNPGLLSYSSLELRNGIWCNLVLFHDAAAQAHIKQGKTHTYAAYQLAPRYYKWIRLHNGIVMGGLSQGTFVLQKTRHFTFEAPNTRPFIQEMTYL